MKLKHLCIAFAVLMVAGCGGPPELPIRRCPGPISRLRARSPSILMYPPTSSPCKTCLSGTRAISGRIRRPRIPRYRQRAEYGFLCFHAAACEYFSNQPHGVLPLGCDIGWTSPGAVSFTLMTPLKRFVVGCTQADTDTQLANVMATHSVNLSTTTPHLRPAQRLLVNSCEPHERSVIAGNGYALSRRAVEVVADTIQPGGTGGLFDPAGGPPILSIFEPNTVTTPGDPTDLPNFRASVA